MDGVVCGSPVPAPRLGACVPNPLELAGGLFPGKEGRSQGASLNVGLPPQTGRILASRFLDCRYTEVTFLSLSPALHDAGVIGTLG